MAGSHSTTSREEMIGSSGTSAESDSTIGDTRDAQIASSAKIHWACSTVAAERGIQPGRTTTTSIHTQHMDYLATLPK